MNLLKTLLATTFGLGLLPGPRGTYGCLPVIALFWFWRDAPWWVAPVGALLFSIITVWLGPFVVKRWPKPKPNSHEIDPSQCCCDETTGQFLTLTALAVTPATLIIGFLLFRLLDVLKPPPADISQKLPLGLGILADDLIVAVYANLILWAMVAGNWIAWLDWQMAQFGIANFMLP